MRPSEMVPAISATPARIAAGLMLLLVAALLATAALVLRSRRARAAAVAEEPLQRLRRFRLFGPDEDGEGDAVPLHVPQLGRRPVVGHSAPARPWNGDAGRPADTGSVAGATPRPATGAATAARRTSAATLPVATARAVAPALGARTRPAEALPAASSALAPATAPAPSALAQVAPLPASMAAARRPGVPGPAGLASPTGVAMPSTPEDFLPSPRGSVELRGTRISSLPDHPRTSPPRRPVGRAHLGPSASTEQPDWKTPKPARAAAEPAPVAPPPGAEARPTPTSVAVEMAKDGILIVEDDETIAGMYQMLLSTKGYPTRHACDGVEGIAMVREQRPALILLDMKMPRMDGIQFLDALRQWPGGGNVPVVVLSNVADRDLVQKALALGAIEYLVKAQTRPQVLLGALPHWLRGNRALTAAG